MKDKIIIKQISIFMAISIVFITSHYCTHNDDGFTENNSFCIIIYLNYLHNVLIIHLFLFYLYMFLGLCLYYDIYNNKKKKKNY